MRRSMNGTRSAATNGASISGRQLGSSVTRRGAAVTDENHAQGDRTGSVKDEFGTPGPVTARLKLLEKKYSQVLEMQAKFSIMDKWIEQQFGIKLFPPPVVKEKVEEGDPEDVDSPFYAVYLVVQRLKFLEEKVKKLEARPLEEFPEPKPTSNYSSANAFRNFKAGKGASGGAVKRSYVSSSPTTPKKAKLVGRPPAPSSNYPFKPSVKILPRDPSMPSPLKKEEPPKDSSPVKQVDDANSSKLETRKESREKDKSVECKGTETVIVVTTLEDKSVEKEIKTEEPVGETMETDEAVAQNDGDADAATQVMLTDSEEKKDTDETLSAIPSSQETNIVETESENPASEVVKEEVIDDNDVVSIDKDMGAEEAIPILEDATARVLADDMGGDESGQEEVEMEVEQKHTIPLDDELGGDVSGSEASVSSLASSSSKPRLSTRRRQALVAATATSSTSAAEKPTEEEKPVMYTARGRRHTVPRRYAEFTGHDNVVSILKSQQRAEKTAAAAGSSKSGRRQPASPAKSQDTPPKIKKMVKSTKTPSPKKLPILTDSDGEGEPGPSKKKPGPNAVPLERPPCVDALVERVMAREVDSDGMVVLAETYPNIYVNQQQLITVIVRSNGKSTRLTRKMTTLVFEDSVLASASPFGTKYYKDRLPPEPLEAMVDFIADSGFEPHYSKKKIYMIVGQVCNEARAGRVSRKFMQPLEAAPGSSQSSQDALSPDPTTTPTPESSPQ